MVQLNLVDANERLPQSLPPSFAPLFETLELSDAQHSRRHVSYNHAPPSAEERTQYMFVMTLELRSRPLGRWNRLDIESYDSVNLETGDTIPVALKHERPFWFSKVRSY
jgi:F-box protein 9